PPCSNGILVRCGIFEPVSCSWMLSLIRASWFAAGTLPPHRDVDRENWQYPFGIPEGSIQKNVLRALFYLAFRVNRSRLSRTHLSVSPPFGFAQSFSSLPPLDNWPVPCSSIPLLLGGHTWAARSGPWRPTPPSGGQVRSINSPYRSHAKNS